MLFRPLWSFVSPYWNTVIPHCRTSGHHVHPGRTQLSDRCWHGMECYEKRQLFNTLISAKLLSEELINSLLKPQRFTLVASVPLGLRACLHNHVDKCEILHDCCRVFLEPFSKSSRKHKSCISEFNLNRFMMHDPFFLLLWMCMKASAW